MKPITQHTLEDSVLATAAYFDVLGLAVTPFELWKYLLAPSRFGADKTAAGAATLKKIYEVLERPFLGERLAVTGGFVRLKGRAGLIEARIAAMKQSAHKLRRARRIVRRLRWLPFIRAVYVSGSVAVGHPREVSDIDLLIVAAEGRLWLTRTLVTLLTWLLGVKRQGRRTRDRVCLNHYITSEHLRIPYPSLYNAITYAHLLPLWERTPGLLAKFYAANSWLGDFLARPLRDSMFRWQLNDHQGISQDIRNILEYFLSGRVGRLLERWLSVLESRRIASDPRTHAPGGRVRASATQLEFHPDSREADILAEYNRRLKEFGFKSVGPELDSGLIH